MKTNPTPYIDHRNELDVFQFTFMRNVCNQTDVGAKATLDAIAEKMRVDASDLKAICKRLFEKGYIKPGAKHITPLRRQDGRAYQKPKKKAGITICEPAFCEGYEPFDQNWYY